MKTEQNKTKQLVLTGMMTAVVCVLSILEIPMPTGVPITLQTFALALCGYLLGWKKGGLAALLYLLLGAAGVPVFSGMTGGIQVMLGLTGGFIWGFPVLAVLSGLGSGKKPAALAVAFGVFGLAVVHLLGALQFSLLSGNTYLTSLMLVSVPYLVKDLLSVAGAYLVSLALKKALKAANLYCPG